ncbi:MAG: phage tail protein [Desulfosalsimonas sp.]
MKHEEIKKILPGMFREAVSTQNPLDAIVGVMETLHHNTEAMLEEIDSVFDPIRTNKDFVWYLAGWVDLDWIYSQDGKNTGSLKSAIQIENFRNLISLAWYLSKWRGTATGLKLFLETATGVEGFEINENPEDDKGGIMPFHIEITVPEAAEQKRHLVKRIIENEKPAYVTYTMVLKEK